MADIHEVVCPRCKVGFAPDTVVCPICKIVLVPRDEVSKTPAPVMLTDDLSSLEKVRTADLDWIHHLQDSLAEAGIPHRVERVELSNRRQKYFAVYVRPEDHPIAREIDTVVFGVEVPDAEGMLRVEELDFWSCPACGNRLGEKDLKCSSCGLVLFPTEGWRCKNCNGAVEINVAVCPHCGSQVDWSQL
jgi:RNA polymerase subunit RPABC4/transcription elongation factor Spt4